MLKANAITKLPAFTNTFTTNTNYANYNLATDESYISLTKLQYKFKINSSPSTTVNWVVIFTPKTEALRHVRR
jgi:hypothetical protein